MFKWIFIVISLVLSVTAVYAEGPSVSFSSAYTHLSKECKWAYSKLELSEGQDNALLCKGVGKYQIYIYFSAMDSWLSIRMKDQPDTQIFDSAIGGIDEKKGVVEWRMANGIPFAIIVRSREHSGHEESRTLLKESLVVRGLGQYSKISGVIQVNKNINDNEKARKLADDGFNKKIHPANKD